MKVACALAALVALLAVASTPARVEAVGELVNVPDGLVLLAGGYVLYAPTITAVGGAVNLKNIIVGRKLMAGELVNGDTIVVLYNGQVAFIKSLQALGGAVNLQNVIVGRKLQGTSYESVLASLPKDLTLVDGAGSIVFSLIDGAVGKNLDLSQFLGAAGRKLKAGELVDIPRGIALLTGGVIAYSPEVTAVGKAVDIQNLLVGR